MNPPGRSPLSRRDNNTTSANLVAIAVPREREAQRAFKNIRSPVSVNERLSSL